MRNIILAISFFIPLICSAQKKNERANANPKAKRVINVSLTPENWEFKPNSAEFIQYQNVPALRILTSSDVISLKGVDFINGTIEYDMEPIDPSFTGIYFRRTDQRESEYFYFRVARAGDTNAVDAIQYAPFLGGVNFWDMLFHFQGNADFRKQQWNHVKLVINGRQMKVYLNHESKPRLEVPRLEGTNSGGSIAFDGQAIISNLSIKPDDVEGVDPIAGIDQTDNDPRYLRQWRMTSPVIFTQNIDFDYDLFPKDSTKWEPVTAERRGLINLTRKFGKSEKRRFVWLKTTINSGSAQTRRLNLGFSDEVWIFLNGRYLYIDKNYYASPIMKQPDGRCTVDNTSFEVPLSAGKNELMIAVANNFFGWGIIARFDKMAGMTFENP